MRISKALLVLVVGTLGCKSKLDKTLGSPSLDGARSLWTYDRVEMKERVATLDPIQRDAWADVFEQNVHGLFGLARSDPKAAVEEFCSFLDAMVPTPPARDKLSVRVRSLCDDVARAREAKERLARQRSDAEDAMKRSEDELKAAIAELKDVQSGERQVFGYNGMMIAALSSIRYEVTQFEARIIRNSYCAPGDDCSGRMGVGIGADHDILETTKTRFTSPGEISICVRGKGRELVKINGFDTHVTVYEEVDDPNCGSGQVAAANKRVSEARAALENAKREFGLQPLEGPASTDHLRATSAVLLLLDCVEKKHGDCLAEGSVNAVATPAQLPGAAAPDRMDASMGSGSAGTVCRIGKKRR